MSTTVNSKVLTYNEAKRLLSKTYGYSEKDIQSEDIVVAMFKQENIDVIMGGTSDNRTFALSEQYAIKDFTKPVTINLTADSTSSYVIGGINVLDLMTNYQKEKFNLPLWCYLANLNPNPPEGTSNTIDLDTLNSQKFDTITEDKLVMMFDELVLLGYLKEEEDELIFSVDKQITTYKAKKHNGMRFAGYTK